MTFLDLLAFRNIPFRQTSRLDELKLCCPFCQDTNFCLALNVRKNVAYCHHQSCQWKSRQAIRFVLEALQIREVPSDGFGGGAAPQVPQKPETVELPREYFPLRGVRPSEELVGDPVRYLLRRGITRMEMDRHYFGACLTGRYAYRIIMPVLYGKQLRGIVARDWTGSQSKKYLGNIGLKTIWNLRKAEVQPLILAEGIFKAIALERVLQRPAAALLGHSVTDEMLESLLKKKHSRVVIWPDPDRVGQEGLLSLVDRFQEARILVDVPYPLPLKQADEEEPSTLAKVATMIQPVTFNLLQRVRLEMLQ